MGLLGPRLTLPLLPTETLGFSQRLDILPPVTSCIQEVPNKTLLNEGKKDDTSLTL